MIHYILQESDKSILLQLREEFKNILNERNIDIFPVLLTDGTYCLPETIVNDPKYTDLLQILLNRNLLQNLIKREVLPGEVVGNNSTLL